MNCVNAVGNRSVLCIQDSSAINLYNHKNRIQKDNSIGTTNTSFGGLGFHIHPFNLMFLELFRIIKTRNEMRTIRLFSKILSPKPDVYFF